MSIVKSVAPRLRETMPIVTEFVDAMRLVFGAQQINQQIRDGIAGHGTFWARENGVEVGSIPFGYIKPGEQQ